VPATPGATAAATGGAGLPAPWSWIFPAPAPTVAPIPGNEFQDAGVNPFMDPARDPFSTFAMDVDTASYGVARRFLEEGRLPERDSVRLEEYVNSFDYDYATPTEGAFAVHVEGAPAPFVGSRAILLRVGLQAREIDIETRPPVSLTFVIDTSGSMQMDNRLELVKAALGLLVSRLTAQDSVAIVSFGSDASIVLPPTSAAEPEAILSAIGGLSTSGSTNAQAGLELGYDLAAFAHRPGTLDRVVLASDGVANVGLTDADSILARIDREVDAGVELVTIGVGMGNFNDVLLEQLADRGNGFYAYVNDKTEADRVFGSELTGTLFTVARDAKIQVEFRPDAVGRYRLLGYENRAIADEDFRNPYVDAGEVGAGHSVTALYEIEPVWTSSGFLGTIRLRWLDPETGVELQLIRDIELGDLGADFYATSPSFRLAATVAGFAEILRESPYVSGYSLNDVAREAASLTGLLAGRSDVADFNRLTQLAARIRGF
jgi:Ca-activated chloride channel family protein